MNVFAIIDKETKKGLHEQSLFNIIYMLIRSFSFLC